MSVPTNSYTSAAANEDFIPFQSADHSTRSAAKTLVLQGLAHPGVGAGSGNPLVTTNPIVLASPSFSSCNTEDANKKSTGTSTDRYTRAIRFHCPTNTILRTLFNRAVLDETSKSIFGRPTADIDENYAHHLLSPWPAQSDVDRLFIISSSYTTRRFVPFTVRFGKRILKKIEANPDQAFHILRHRLVQLNKLGPVVLVLESGKNGIYHLHGFVDTSEDFKVVRAHLQHLGGYSSDTSFRNVYQVAIKNGLHALGWANYLVKELIDLPEEQQEPRIYISRSAAKIGRGQLEHLRQQCERKFSVRPERRGRSATTGASMFRDDAGRFRSANATVH